MQTIKKATQKYNKQTDCTKTSHEIIEKRKEFLYRKSSGDRVHNYPQK